MAAIRANNVIAAIGKSENDAQQFNLLSNATLQSAEDFRELVVVEREGTVIKLGDIARVEIGETRGSSNARLDMDNTIYLSIWPMPGANEIEIGDCCLSHAGQHQRVTASRSDHQYCRRWHHLYA